LQQPNCLQCKIEQKGNKIAVEVEREFVVKLIGETKVNVKVSHSHHKEHHHKKHGRFDDGSEDNVKADFVKGKRR